MTLGPFRSSSPSFTSRALDPFFYNRSLQQEGLELRLADYVDDVRYDMRAIGGAIIKQQEKAADRYRADARATTDAVRAQTNEIAGLRRDQAAHAAQITGAIEDSAKVVRAGIDQTNSSIETMRSELSTQLTHIQWALARQSDLLSDILEVLRENRKNECRQLVEQGALHLQRGFLSEARERLEAALAFDSTDYDLHQQLGFTFVRLGDLDRALAHFQKALAFAPSEERCGRLQSAFAYARAATHVARAHYARAEYREAAEHLEKALRAEPTNAKNWYDLSVMCAYLGDAARGAKAIVEAGTLEPFYLGRAFADAELDPIRTAVDAAAAETANAMMGKITARVEKVRASIVSFVTEANRLRIAASLPILADVETVISHAQSVVALDAARKELEAMESAVLDELTRATKPALDDAKKQRDKLLEQFTATWYAKRNALDAALREAEGSVVTRFLDRKRIQTLRNELQREFSDAAFRNAQAAARAESLARVKAIEHFAGRVYSRRATD